MLQKVVQKTFVLATPSFLYGTLITINKPILYVIIKAYTFSIFLPSVFGFFVVVVPGSYLLVIMSL